MKGFKTAAVIPNLTKKGAYQTSLEVINRLMKLGMDIVMSEKLRDRYKSDRIKFCKDNDELFNSCDMVLTIGGDGTIIHAARHAAPLDKPLLGINMGRLGFVAELEPNELDMLSRLTDGDYNIEKRMMLKIVHKSGDKLTELHAMNDAVISRGSLSRLIDIDVSLAGERGYICTYRADGLIFSTPTGSSAYSLAAGGLPTILMTPVCSHSLFARPVVFSHHSEISVSASCDDGTHVYVTMDGIKTVTIKKEDTIFISCSQTETEFIKLKDKTFYRVLKDKFNEKGRQ